MTNLSKLQRLAIVSRLLFPAVARTAPPETFQLVPVGPEHAIAVPTGLNVARGNPALGDERFEPVVACRLQIFEESSPDGQQRYCRAVATLVGTDGPIEDDAYLVFADSSTGYLIDMLTGDDPAELLRRAEAGELFVNMLAIEEDEQDRLELEQEGDE